MLLMTALFAQDGSIEDLHHNSPKADYSWWTAKSQSTTQGLHGRQLLNSLDVHSRLHAIEQREKL
jgi:hypothetical protein